MRGIKDMGPEAVVFSQVDTHVLWPDPGGIYSLLAGSGGSFSKNTLLSTSPLPRLSSQVRKKVGGGGGPMSNLH